MTYYSLEEYGKLGDNVRKKIIPRFRMINKLNSALGRGKNKNGRRLKNKKQVKKKIASLYKNIQNYVKEIHHKSAQYFCENYDTITLPEFKT